MDSPASPPAPDGRDIRARVAALNRHIKDMRRDLKDTSELVDRLRENCDSLQAKLTVAEQEYAVLLKQADSL